MMSYDPAPVPQNFPQVEEAWQELDDLVDEIVRLAGSDLSAQNFISRYWIARPSPVRAVGGAIWIRHSGGQIQLECQVNLDGVPLGRQLGQRPAPHPAAGARLVQAPAGRGAAGRRCQAKLWPRSAWRSCSGRLWRSTSKRSASSKFFSDLVPRRGSERGVSPLSATLNDLAADFQRNAGQLRQLRRARHPWECSTGSSSKPTPASISTTCPPPIRLPTTAGPSSVAIGSALECFAAKRCASASAISDALKSRLRLLRFESVRFLEKVAAAVAKTEEPFLWHDDDRTPSSAADRNRRWKRSSTETARPSHRPDPALGQATPRSDAKSAGGPPRRGRPRACQSSSKNSTTAASIRPRASASWPWLGKTAAALSKRMITNRFHSRLRARIAGRVAGSLEAKQLPKTTAALAIGVAAILCWC